MAGSSPSPTPEGVGCSHGPLRGRCLPTLGLCCFTTAGPPALGPSALPTWSCTEAGPGPGPGQVKRLFLVLPSSCCILPLLFLSGPSQSLTAQGSRPHPSVCGKTSHCWPRGVLGCSDRGHSLAVACLSQSC